MRSLTELPNHNKVREKITDGRDLNGKAQQ